MPRASRPLLRRPDLSAALVAAVRRASEARPARREQRHATTASLKAKRELGVHRPAVATPRTCPRRRRRASSAQSRCPSAEGLGLQSGALDLFGVRADPDRNGEIFDVATFPPIRRLTRQNTTGLSCHQHRADGLSDVANGVGDHGDDGLEHVGSYLSTGVEKALRTYGRSDFDRFRSHPSTCENAGVSTTDGDPFVRFSDLSPIYLEKPRAKSGQRDRAVHSVGSY
jgi:hypothetical protein